MKAKSRITSPIDVKRPKTTLKRVRKPEQPVDSLKNVSTQNERYSIQVSELEARRQMLLDTLSDLNKRVVEDGNLIVGLRERFQTLLTKKQKPDYKNKYGEEAPQPSSTVSSIIEEMRSSPANYLDKNPIIIEDMYNNTDVFSEVAEFIPDDCFSAFMDVSMEQVNALARCIMHFDKLKEWIQSPTFRQRAQDFAKTIMNTSEATILVYDQRCKEYYTEIAKMKYYFPVYKDKSFVAKALYEQKPYVVNAPTDSDLYYPAMDQLMNPGNRPLMTVPIKQSGILYICCTNAFKKVFSKFDMYLATFFCDLIAPLLDQNNQYMEMVHATEHKRSLQIFRINLVSKADFQELIPFLYETFSECLSALDFELFLYQKGVFFTFKNNGKGELISKEHSFIGLPSLIVKTRDNLRFDKVIEKTASYNEDIDKWTFNNCFIGVPVFLPNGEIIGVLCLSGKRNANKFTQWDTDFMELVSQSLALIFPHCITRLEPDGLKQRFESSSSFPKIISSYSYELMKDPKFFSTVCKDIQELFDCEYVGIYKKETFGFKSVGQTCEKPFLNDEFISSLLSEDVSKATNNVKELNKFEPVYGITFTNISYVSHSIGETRIAVVIMNVKISLTKGDSFLDPSTSKKLKSFASIVHFALNIQNVIQLHETTDINTRTIKNVFDVCVTATSKENQLNSLLTMVTDLIKMHSFCIFEKRAMKKAYFPYIGSPNVRMSGMVPMDDVLAQVLMTSDIINTFENFVAGTYKSSHFTPIFRTFTVMVGLKLNKDADYLMIFVGKELSSNFRNLISLFTPLLNILLHNYVIENNNTLIKELNLVNITESKIFEVEISSRTFSISKYDESSKIELLLKIFSTLEIIRTLCIDIHKLVPLFYEIRSHYNKLPYHNWDHAIDTVQFIFAALKRGKLARIFTTQHIIALIFAALMHDIDHDGTSSAFHKNTSSPFSIIYGDESTLERYHCAKAAEILKKQGFFTLINTPEFWNLFTGCIMATDISKYPVYMDNFITTIPVFNSKNEDHRLVFGEYLMVCANIVNTTRVFQESVKAVTSLQAELELQNKEEKELGLKPTPFYGASKNVLINSVECDFLEEVALPIYRQICQSVPELGDLLVQIEDNVNQWRKYVV